jgi:hypothetical protein
MQSILLNLKQGLFHIPPILLRLSPVNNSPKSWPRRMRVEVLHLLFHNRIALFSREVVLIVEVAITQLRRIRLAQVNLYHGTHPLDVILVRIVVKRKIGSQ